MDDANFYGENGYPIALCTIAYRMSRAESDSLAQDQICEEWGPVSLFGDNTPTPVIELENRKCATDSLCYGCCFGR